MVNELFVSFYPTPKIEFELNTVYAFAPTLIVTKEYTSMNGFDILVAKDGLELPAKRVFAV